MDTVDVDTVDVDTVDVDTMSRGNRAPWPAPAPSRPTVRPPRTGAIAAGAGSHTVAAAATVATGDAVTTGEAGEALPSGTLPTGSRAVQDTPVPGKPRCHGRQPALPRPGTCAVPTRWHG